MLWLATARATLHLPDRIMCNTCLPRYVSGPNRWLKKASLIWTKISITAMIISKLVLLIIQQNKWRNINMDGWGCFCSGIDTCYVTLFFRFLCPLEKQKLLHLLNIWINNVLCFVTLEYFNLRSFALDWCIICGYRMWKQQQLSCCLWTRNKLIKICGQSVW